ncbi:uncharacterized protein LOC133839986 [Drosophila sulfurigaster albostrigata]|uniref:uncharacterized protein LOC133839986 n=1 Tax=Drosophila sulfurigaster albostrigata TaxID=89887 RepID=UPI002D21DB9A|nr:uncharacterized protein LOC133839986 [Drosophila sulfurigaster albostrigata]
MLHSMHLVTVALACPLLVGISQAQGPHGVVDVPTSHLIAEDVMNLGLKLTTGKMSGVYADTFLISPVSIASALASLLLAAKGESFIELSKQFSIKDTVKLHEQFGYMLRNAQQTYKDITQFIEENKWIKEEVKETQQVFIGSVLFVQQDHSINLDYRQALAQIYNSEIYPADFEKDPSTAVDLMNVWVTQKTQRKITNIVNLFNINKSTRMALINTMYFNARWVNNFYETRSEPFYPDGYDSKTKLYVPTMVATGSYTFDLNMRRNCLILGIPYRGGQNTLYIIQPFQSSIRRLKEFQKTLTAASIEEMISKMRSITGKIRLPKMRIIGGDHLKYLLNDFPIKGIFSNKNYDLSLIASGNSSTQLYQSDAVGNLRNLETQRKFAESEPKRSADLYIMDIIHKVRLDVAEKGTEGASATEASMSRTVALFDFIINSPFILLVRNDFTRLPLFYGIINKPPSIASLYYAFSCDKQRLVKMKLFGYIIVAFACLLFTGILQAQIAVPEVDVAISDAIALKVLSFALKIKSQMITDNAKTIVFSPVSIMSALAIIMIGTRNERLSNLTELFGQTDVEKMNQQFGLMLQDVVSSIKENTSPLRKSDPWHQDSTDESMRTYLMHGNGTQRVRLAIGLFLQKGTRLKLPHRQKITANYLPDILHVDFKRRSVEAMNTINSWIDMQTDENVDEMVRNTFDTNTDRVIMSILTLKAKWEMDFITGLTKNRDFYRDREGSEKPISVPMMTGAGALPYYLNTDLECHIIGIPYEGEMTTMYLIKPLKSSVKLLEAFHEKLTAESIEEMIKKMRRGSTSVVLPRMKFDEMLVLRSPMERMGLGSIFDPLQSFTNKKSASRGSLSTKVLDDFTVTQFCQKVYFRVDEKGTEIGDGTGAVEVRTAAAATFRADEPFIMLVRNDITKLPLFYGIINEPITAAL